MNEASEHYPSSALTPGAVTRVIITTSCRALLWSDHGEEGRGWWRSELRSPFTSECVWCLRCHRCNWVVGVHVESLVTFHIITVIFSEVVAWYLNAWNTEVMVAVSQWEPTEEELYQKYIKYISRFIWWWLMICVCLNWHITVSWGRSKVGRPCIKIPCSTWNIKHVQTWEMTTSLCSLS